MQIIESKILTKIKKAGRGTLFFNDDFTQFGTSKAANKALERLVEKGEINRVARGIYTRPKTSALLGEIPPSINEIAEAIARRDRAKIIPTGAMALYQIGLSTQVPLQVVYLTDGSPRSLQVGNGKIVFKKTTAKKLAIRGEASVLAIQALKEIGKENYTAEQKKRVIELLRKENPNHLQHDIRLAPEWIRKIMREAL